MSASSSSAESRIICRMSNTSNNGCAHASFAFDEPPWKGFVQIQRNSSNSGFVKVLLEAKPYNSHGNGSAMRVAAVGWLYDSLERTRAVAQATAEVSHNRPEGAKGADSVAAAIFMARTGSSKEEIKEYVEWEFGYDLSRTCDEIRPTYEHVESCQETVPQAFAAFLEGDSFENVVRLAILLGGDCDTLTDIAAAMAEGFYGADEKLEKLTLLLFPTDLKAVYERLQKGHGGCHV